MDVRKNNLEFYFGKNSMDNHTERTGQNNANKLSQFEIVVLFNREWIT